MSRVGTERGSRKTFRQELGVETSAERGRLEFFAIVGGATLLLLGIAVGAWRRGTDFHPLTEFGRLAVFLGFSGVAIVAAYVFLTSKSIDSFLASRKSKEVGLPPAL